MIHLSFTKAILKCFKSSIFALAFFLTFNTSIAQSLLLSGTCYDKISTSPLSYVSVFKGGSSKIIDAGADGRFSIECTNKDTIIFSMIGYKPLSIGVNDFLLRHTDSVFLTPEAHPLAEIKITNSKPQIFGILNLKQTTSYAGEISSNRCEYATLIKIPPTISSYRVSKVFIRQKHADDTRPIRLHIYSVGKNGKPYKELLAEDEILTTPDKNIVTIDLKGQNVIIDNASFFVGIQWLLPARKSKKSNKFTADTGIGMTNKVPESLTFVKALYTHYKWNEIPDFFTKNRNPINMLVSAEIYPITK